MNSPADIRQRLLHIAEPVCADNGYELVDIDYASGPSGWVVRIYIDRASDWAASTRGGISFDDCERLSRQLGAVLDVEDPIPHAYSLEVSSPGFDRPLRTADHFQRYLGQTAKVALAEPKDGRRNFKGTLRAVEPSGAEGGSAGGADILVIEVDGQDFRLPLADIASARLIPDWDSLMKRGGARNQGT